MTTRTFKTLTVALQWSTVLLILTSCTAAPVPVHFSDYSARSFTGLLEDLQANILYGSNGDNFEIDHSIYNNDVDSSTPGLRAQSVSYSDLTHDFGHSVRQLDTHAVSGITYDQSEIKDGYLKSVSTGDLSNQAAQPHPHVSAGQEEIHASTSHTGNTEPSETSNEKADVEASPQDHWHTFINGLHYVTPGIAQAAEDASSAQGTTPTKPESVPASASLPGNHAVLTPPNEEHGIESASATEQFHSTQHASYTPPETHPTTNIHPELQTPPKLEHGIETAPAAAQTAPDTVPETHPTTITHPELQTPLKAEHGIETAPAAEQFHPTQPASHSVPDTHTTINNLPDLQTPLKVEHGIDTAPTAEQFNPTQPASHSVPETHTTINNTPDVHHVTEEQPVHPDHPVAPAAAVPQIHPNPAAQATPPNDVIIDDEPEGDHCRINTHGVRTCD